MAYSTFMHNGRKLEYLTAGEGQPVVFLHGLGGSILQMTSAFDLPEGVRGIYLNQQGHGESDFDPEHFDFDTMGDDTAALLARLGVKKAVFAGISMGAAVSLNIAVRYPQLVEKLFLVRNAWADQPMSQAVQTAYRDLGLALKEKDEELFWNSEGGKIVKGLGSAYSEGAFSGPFKETPQLANWQKFLLLPPSAPVRSVSEIEALKVPAVVIACRGDFCHPFEMGEYMKEHLDGAVLYEIPGKDVDAAEHKRLSNRYFREFLAGSERPE